MQKLKNLLATLAFIFFIGVIGGMDQGTIPMLPGLCISLVLLAILYRRGKEVQREDKNEA
ncbi:MAG: hypothetical protein SPK23_01485 [Eubacteriales bacterium]|nr:hypothetical protein [Eubacteriales bacterium]